MARKFKLTKDSATGWWGWYCKSDDIITVSGIEPTRKLARDAAKSACSDYVLQPPKVSSIEIQNGQMIKAQIVDLEGNFIDWDSNCNNWGLTEDNINWFFGFECSDDLSDSKKVVTMLKIWGLYYGGITQTDLESKYSLNPIQFAKLAAKDIVNLEIEVTENLIFTWNFPI